MASRPYERALYRLRDEYKERFREILKEENAWGDTNSRRYLTKEERAEIRKEMLPLLREGWTQERIARRYGKTRGFVNYVLSGK